MLNILWPIFIIISFIFSVGTGKINQLNTAIFDSAKDAVQMTITFFGTICMWNGVMKILQETSIMSKMTKLVSPIMKFLFPTIKKEDKEYKDLINRLSRIEGQVRGIKKMVENDTYCTDILVQVSAVNAALNSFNKVLLANHIRTCVAEDIREGKDETIDELVKVLQKLMK